MSVATDLIPIQRSGVGTLAYVAILEQHLSPSLGREVFYLNIKYVFGLENYKTDLNISRHSLLKTVID